MSTVSFHNVYEDEIRARSYADLEFPGTYYLAFRDLPKLFAKHVTGRNALDFGCGAGRSTRFLRDHGFEATGVDISGEMLREAVARDSNGRYIHVGDDLSELGQHTFDLILSAFTFDNIPGREQRTRLFRQLAARLAPEGRIVNLVSSPEIYVNEWSSFSTRAFPENRNARSGELVRTIMLDVPDRRPVDDIIWAHEDYLALFAEAGLYVIETHRPLGTEQDPVRWVSETSVAPWTIYVVGKQRKDV